MFKYITVLNRRGLSVPFYYNEFGEVFINSIHAEDNVDTCYIKAGNVFYEYSQDYIPNYKQKLKKKG